MKKFILSSLVLLLACVLLSCSKSTKDQLEGSWTVSKLSMAGISQDPELMGPFSYELKGDGSYTYTQGEKTESGKWSLSEDEKQLSFEPTSGEAYSKEIGSVSADSVVLNFKSFTMDVNHVLVRP